MSALPSLESLVSYTTTGDQRTPRLVQEPFSFDLDLQKLYLPHLKRLVLLIEEEWHEVLTGLHTVCPNLEALKLALRTDLFDESWETCERSGLRLPEFKTVKILVLEFSTEMYANARVSKLLHLVARSFPNVVELHIDSAHRQGSPPGYRRMEVTPLSTMKSLRFVDIGNSVVGRSGLRSVLNHLPPTCLAISCVLPRSRSSWARFVNREGSQLTCLFPKQNAIFVNTGCFVNGKFREYGIRDLRMDPFAATFLQRKGLSVRRDISPAEVPELP